MVRVGMVRSRQCRRIGPPIVFLLLLLSLSRKSLPTSDRRIISGVSAFYLVPTTAHVITQLGRLQTFSHLDGNSNGVMSTANTSCSTTDDNMPTKKRKRVVIVGAGMAGLSTAYHLCQSRRRSEDILQVELVEARDYIGGRIHTIELMPGLFVDIGGQWIHEASASHNPLVQLCQEELREMIPPLQDNYHVQQQQQRSEDLIVYNIRTGKRVRTSLAKDASRYFYKGMNEFELSDETINENTSFQDLCDSKWIDLSTPRNGRRRGGTSSSSITDSSTLKNPPEEQLDDLRCVWNVCTHRTEIYEGGRLDELSVALCEMYQNKGGPDKLPPNGGYQTLVDAIVQRLTTTTQNGDDDGRYSCRIRLSSPVQSITYNHRQEKVGSSSRSSSSTPPAVTIHLNDEDKTILTADCCVCAVPLGVLKRQAVHFDPPLPVSKQEAIETMGMGLINKIILVFPKAFWQGHSHFGAADPKDARETWSFYDCTLPSHNYYTLMVFLGGNSARRFDPFDDEKATDRDATTTTITTTETTSSQRGELLEEEAVAQVLTVLRRIFPDATIPSPVASHVTSWGSDEYAGGAYSFAKVKSTEQTYQDMMAPVGGCLYFAGEHTSPTAHSTVHGAWETGQREAKRILSLFMDQER